MSKLKKYQVELPIAGAIWVEVDAEDERGAESAAFEALADLDVKYKGKLPFELVELEGYTKITEGNVMHCGYNDMDIHEVK